MVVDKKNNSMWLEKLNEDIKRFPEVFSITADMKITYTGVSRLVMLDRYAYKDIEKKTLSVGDVVILTVKKDVKFPARGLGKIVELDFNNKVAFIQVEEEFRNSLSKEEAGASNVARNFSEFDKPLEFFYEQISKRVALGLSKVERTEDLQKEYFQKFYEQLVNLSFIPAGRVLYGAGTSSQVTFFNCYVTPFVEDSREGIAKHRMKITEIMSRGGGVGTNGSTLRPRNSLARGVNGRSSGAVSWLDDIAKLTHLVEQGGSRRGAQMIMMADWHPDIIEFIISKMQNPDILRFLQAKVEDKQIRQAATDKLQFVSMSDIELSLYQAFLLKNAAELDVSESIIKYAEDKLRDGGEYKVQNPEFLTGANISVCISNELMQAVENDDMYQLRFPDIEAYSKEEMDFYNENWSKIGDVNEWEKLGYAVRVYSSVRARDLWNLINICATYSAEPGIFFIDNANEMTNAISYGQKVVATNPCGEQPLAPWSVCNLAAINLAEMVDRVQKKVDFEKLKETVRIGVRMQDNVIDATPYFLAENKEQALGERRVGLGVMGLHDLLIYCEKVYGSEEGNALVDELFKTIAVTSYEASIELAREKGSFVFLQDKSVEATSILRNRFINSGYMKKMPDHVRDNILKFGIRNSHLLTVAPTGSTGTMVGVATGLEPYYSFSYFRSGRLGKFIEVKAKIVEEYLQENPDSDPNNLPAWFVSAMELSAEAHADIQCVIQRWVDSSISKTVNAPKGYSVTEVAKVYERLYKGGAKGGTVYVDGSRESQVLSLTAEEKPKEFFIEEERHLLVPDTIVSLGATSVMYGSEIGDTCPLCRIGIVENIGGCNSCARCGAQLKCGL